MDWNLDELIEQYATPFYVLNPAVAISRYETLRETLDWSVRFASKSNFDPQLITAMNDADASFVCGSAQEAAVCHSLGVPACNLQVTAVAPSQASITTLVELSKEDHRFITTVNSNSTVTQLADAGYEGRVLLRIPANISDQDDSKYKSGSDIKFGMTMAERRDAIERIQQTDITFYGIHSHLGGSFDNDGLAVFLRHIRRTLQVAEDYREEITMVNFGGGLGYGYNPDETGVYVQRLYDDVKPILEPYEDMFEIVFEPGRFVSAPASILVTEVRTIRERDEQRFVGVDAGMSEFPRTTMFDVYHHISQYSLSDDTFEERELVPQTVAGPTCSGADIFATDRLFSKAEVGDILLIHDVGAYGQIMASHFHAHSMPTVVTVDGTRSPPLGDVVDI